MAKELGYLLSAAYALGIIAVQSHLLRFGILDISPIDVYYFLVGFWILVCTVPGAVASVILDLSLRTEHRHARATALGLVLGIIVSIVVLWFRFKYHQMLLNFNSYPYSEWYVVRNIAGINVALLGIWLILTIARKRGCPFEVARKASVCTATFAVLIFAVFFGRSIYPALDRGVGGGAPQFARLELEGDKAQDESILLVHSGEEFIYFLGLTDFPFENGKQPQPSQHYTCNRSGSVYRALTENRVIKLPIPKIKRITTIGFSQRCNIEKYLSCGAPNPAARADC